MKQPNNHSPNASLSPSHFDTAEKITEYEMDYHREQFDNPKRSTIIFCEFLKQHGCLLKDSSILDLGAGMGAFAHFLSSQVKFNKIVGVDIDRSLVNAGQKILGEKKSTVSLQYGDILKLPEEFTGQYEGVISMQTLSWIEDYENVLEKICSLQSNWIGLTSLFYDGPVSCTIDINEYFGETLDLVRNHQYRVLALPFVKRVFAASGYNQFIATPFEIDIDIEAPTNRLMRTYTRKLEDGKRLQLSGPLLMPWYFILGRRNKK